MSNYVMSIMKVFTRTGRRKLNLSSYSYVLKHYPRIYKLIMDTLARGECPLCGRPLQRQFALAPHARGRNCVNNWMELAKAMYGKNRRSEEEVLEIINKIRQNYGAPPLSFG